VVGDHDIPVNGDDITCKVQPGCSERNRECPLARQPHRRLDHPHVLVENVYGLRLGRAEPFGNVCRFRCGECKTVRLSQPDFSEFQDPAAKSLCLPPGSARPHRHVLRQPCDLATRPELEHHRIPDTPLARLLAELGEQVDVPRFPGGRAYSQHETTGYRASSGVRIVRAAHERHIRGSDMGPGRPPRPLGAPWSRVRGFLPATRAPADGLSVLPEPTRLWRIPEGAGSPTSLSGLDPCGCLLRTAPRGP
jgi:hypothetical protein